ncbi:MAG: hypothetical protein IKB34_06690 [Clostridia bacterium]|nr:hypothetical protein [Clostridia bacterium]
MTLTVFPDFKALWLAPDTERDLSSSASSCTIEVRDQFGTPVSGMLTVNGHGFPVINGAAKLLTEKLSPYGCNIGTFTASSGIKYPCAHIISLEKSWRFPSPSECIDDSELIGLLRLVSKLRDSIAGAAPVGNAPISQIIGI